MNLLCPNCQKMLTVPEQYAGQLMKCPLCTGTFTVPGLPAAPPPTPPDVYPVKTEPARTPPPPQPEPAGPEPTALESADQAPPPPPAAGYPNRFQVWLSPKVLAFVPPAALFLVFVLTFFKWVGAYPGGTGLYTQNAWQAGFNGLSVDEELERDMPFKADKDKPGVNWLTIFYLLLFFPALVLAAAAAAVPFVGQSLPPALKPYLPWRWAAAGGLALFVFLFLAFQLLAGFRLENYLKDKADEELKPGKVEGGLAKKSVELLKGVWPETLRRTVWLRLAVALHLLAVVCCLLNFWLDRRGSRPLPRLDVLW